MMDIANALRNCRLFLFFFAFVLAAWRTEKTVLNGNKISKNGLGCQYKLSISYADKRSFAFKVFKRTCFSKLFKRNSFLAEH
jgi:hypothetical protein